MPRRRWARWASTLLEVVVVDDGSTDRTPAMVREAAARDGTFVPLLRGGANEGKGAALRAGAAAARGDLILFVDVDMSTPLRRAREAPGAGRREGPTWRSARAT